MLFHWKDYIRISMPRVREEGGLLAKD